LLELAYTTDARITAPVLAYFAACSIEDAEKVLDNLVARDRIAMEIEDDGSITYEIPDRQKLAPRNEGAPLHAIVHHPSRPLALRRRDEASPGIAAALSLLIPGAGHAYTGHYASAVLWFLLVSAGYTLVLPGVFLHLFAIASAAGSAHRLNSWIARRQLQAG
jgi:hypothetical protein